ncbi:unnamed protein product [Mytilus coruscus]|uniref:Ig-like domain-containing protein n=1 Tax=Mytilus coruscus TaxID=42192 RepID=A0A6J8C1H3_MYTCO|nr:unnamed protein product [Mytilus coruscus]
MPPIKMFVDEGTLAANVSINPNITELLGNKDTDLTCSFFLDKNENIFNVELFAKDISKDFHDKKPIAIFKPDNAAKLHTSGNYLLGRVTLTNITHASTNATLQFHELKYIDEKDYMCKCNVRDTEGAHSVVKSATTRILVKVPVRDVHINNQPNQTQYDRKTDNITLTCTAIGDPEPKYMWFKGNNNNTIISWTNRYVIEDVIQNNSGVYTCKAYNKINNVYYSHSNTVLIDIVDELMSSTVSALSKNSAVHAAYAVPILIAVVLIVICLAVRKHRRKQSQIYKPDYTSVTWRNNNAVEKEGENDCFDMKEVKINSRNEKQQNGNDFVAY